MNTRTFAAATALFLASGALADGFVAQSIPPSAREAMVRLEKQGRTVRCAAFSSTENSWIVLPSGEEPLSQGLRFRDSLKLASLFARGVFLNWAAFSPSGGLVVLYDESGYYARDLPADLAETLARLASEKRQLKHVSFTQSGGWIVLYDRNGAVSKDVPAQLTEAIQILAEDGHELRGAAFDPRGGWHLLWGDGQTVSGGGARALPAPPVRGAHQLAAVSYPPGGGLCLLYR